MSKHSKKYRKIAKKFDKTKTYSLKEAIELAQKSSYSNFTGSIELHTKIKIPKDKDPKSIKGALTLPYPINKELNIIVFAEPKKAKIAKKNGASEAGLDKLVKKVKEGKIDFDLVIATPNAMPKIGVLGKILGPKGLMPTPKNKTVTEDIAETLKKHQSGLFTYQCDSGGNIHIVVGKCDWDTDKIEKNINKAVESIAQIMHKPVHNLFHSVYLAPSMGLGFKIEV